MVSLLGRRSFILSFGASLFVAKSGAAFADSVGSHVQGVEENSGMEQGLMEKISSIEPTFYVGVPYYPCAAELRDGEVVDPIYFVDREHYEMYWGSMPVGSSRRLVDAEMIRRVLPSRFRIEPRFSNTISSYLETGMGYRKFYFHMADGAKLLALCGNANDFFDFPAPYTANDVVGVSEYEGTGEDHEVVRSVSSAWCLIG